MTKDNLRSWLVYLCENATKRLKNDEMWQEISKINEDSEFGELNIYTPAKVLELINDNLEYEANDDDDKIRMMSSATRDMDADAELFSYFNQYDIRTATNYHFLHLIRYGAPVVLNAADQNSGFAVDFGSDELNDLAEDIVEDFWEKIEADYNEDLIKHNVDEIDEDLDDLELSFVRENFGGVLRLDDRQTEKVRKAYDELKAKIDERLAKLAELKEKAAAYKELDDENMRRIRWR